MNSLLSKGEIEIVQTNYIPATFNVLPVCFVLANKNCRTDQEHCKERFVVIEHTDQGKNLPVHSFTNAKPQMMRPLASTAAVVGIKIWSEDVSPAYLQSTRKLNSQFFINPLIAIQTEFQ